MTALLLLLSFVLIVGGALIFTNAVEWAGQALNLGHGAVGSTLAAVGTALPESLIPVVALVGGGGEEREGVAIGAVIGAPFMLTTVAMLLVAISAVAFRNRREQGTHIRTDKSSTTRDLTVFLAVFPIALIMGIGFPDPVRYVVAALLVIAYGVYAYRTIKGGGESEGEELTPLYIDLSKDTKPAGWMIVAQFAIGLGLLVGGAELFVEEIVKISESLGIDALVLALVVAPLATELPEKANSFLWIAKSKDSLAIGNLTGALAFQSTIPVALLLVLLDWELSAFSFVAGSIALVGGALAMWRLRKQQMSVPSAIAFGLLFAGFVVYAVVGS
ncbi:MAG: sodium:calcium antiporter [Solirubrobacterales bacterium]